MFLDFEEFIVVISLFLDPSNYFSHPNVITTDRQKYRNRSQSCNKLELSFKCSALPSSFTAALG